MDEREQLKQRVLAALDTESIGKYDFTAVYAEGGLAGDIVEYLAAPYIGKVDYVAGPESLGFVLGSMLARRLGVGFITLRKGGKLPYGPERLVYSDYVDYTGHTKRLEMRGGILKAGDRVLVVDDWMETAATIGACVSVVEKAGGTLAGVAVVGGDLRPESRALIEKGLLRCIILED